MLLFLVALSCVRVCCCCCCFFVCVIVVFRLPFRMMTSSLRIFHFSWFQIVCRFDVRSPFPPFAVSIFVCVIHWRNSSHFRVRCVLWYFHCKWLYWLCLPIRLFPLSVVRLGSGIENTMTCGMSERLSEREFNWKSNKTIDRRSFECVTRKRIIRWQKTNQELTYWFKRHAIE